MSVSTPKLSEPIPHGYYATTVRVTRTVDGWTSTRHSPTFYLHSNVQGIVDEAHAERIAIDMVRDMMAPGDEGIINAHVVFVGTP